MTEFLRAAIAFGTSAAIFAVCGTLVIIIGWCKEFHNRIAALEHQINKVKS